MLALNVVRRGKCAALMVERFEEANSCKQSLYDTKL